MKNLAFLFLLIPSLIFGDSPRPNILFIMADDLGWMDLGCQGNKLIETLISTEWQVRVCDSPMLMLQHQFARLLDVQFLLDRHQRV